jgi:acyl-CoA thioester hydrolase
MARLDRARLRDGIFPFRCEIATRFTDIDVLGHVNNVAMAAIFQEARTRFAHAFDFMNLIKGRRLVVASLTIEFADEMFHLDPIEVSAGLIEIGRTSYRLGQMARQKGRIGAYAEIVQVAGDKTGPIPFDEEWRVALEGLRIAHHPAQAPG